MKRRVLFLCTGNSARSQMAEGWVNHLLGDRWEAFSAGTHPTGYVHPLAIQAMAELGIDISEHRSKSVEEFRGQNFDVVITLCDSAAQECPLWLGPGWAIHMDFPDPAQADGIMEDRLDAFRRVRDSIRERVLGYLETESPEAAVSAGRRDIPRMAKGG